MNPTGAGSANVFAELVVSGPGLKNSVSICGETTSISLAEGVTEELFRDSGLGKAGEMLVGNDEDGIDGGTTEFVSIEFGLGAAVNVEFVRECRSIRIGGSVKENAAMAREKRSGGGPICFK